MNLREIFTEELSPWEEGIVATAFLNALPIEKLAIDAESKKKVQIYLSILNTLPWTYAKEVCYGVMRKEYVKSN